LEDRRPNSQGDPYKIAGRVLQNDLPRCRRPRRPPRNNLLRHNQEKRGTNGADHRVLRRVFPWSAGRPPQGLAAPLPCPKREKVHRAGRWLRILAYSLRRWPPPERLSAPRRAVRPTVFAAGSRNWPGNVSTLRCKTRNASGKRGQNRVSAPHLAHRAQEGRRRRVCSRISASPHDHPLQRGGISRRLMDTGWLPSPRRFLRWGSPGSRARPEPAPPHSQSCPNCASAHQILGPMPDKYSQIVHPGGGEHHVIVIALPGPNLPRQGIKTGLMTEFIPLAGPVSRM